MRNLYTISLVRTIRVGAAQSENPEVIALGVQGGVPLPDQHRLQYLLTSYITFKCQDRGVLLQNLARYVSVVTVSCVLCWWVVV